MTGHIESNRQNPNFVHINLLTDFELKGRKHCRNFIRSQIFNLIFTAALPGVRSLPRFGTIYQLF
jgi:hypothetical protein